MALLDRSMPISTDYYRLRQRTWQPRIMTFKQLASGTCRPVDYYVWASGIVCMRSIKANGRPLVEGRMVSLICLERENKSMLPLVIAGC